MYGGNVSVDQDDRHEDIVREAGAGSRCGDAQSSAGRESFGTAPNRVVLEGEAIARSERQSDERKVGTHFRVVGGRSRERGNNGVEMSAVTS